MGRDGHPQHARQRRLRRDGRRRRRDVARRLHVTRPSTTSSESRSTPTAAASRCRSTAIRPSTSRSKTVTVTGSGSVTLHVHGAPSADDVVFEQRNAGGMLRMRCAGVYDSLGVGVTKAGNVSAARSRGAARSPATTWPRSRSSAAPRRSPPSPTAAATRWFHTGASARRSWRGSDFPARIRTTTDPGLPHTRNVAVSKIGTPTSYFQGALSGSGQADRRRRQETNGSVRSSSASRASTTTASRRSTSSSARATTSSTCAARARGRTYVSHEGNERVYVSSLAALDLDTYSLLGDLDQLHRNAEHPRG